MPFSLRASLRLSLRPSLIGVLVSAVVLLTACSKPRPDKLDPSLIAITIGANMRTDLIGNSGKNATFVLVDAENRGDRDATVVLVGELRGVDKSVLGTLRPEEIMIPAGARRTFSLVDEAMQARPDAVGASVSIRTTQVATHPLEMVIKDQYVHHDGNRVVAAANLENTANRGGSVIVLASFRDDQGRPLSRPFSLVKIGSHITQPVRFVGPPGSTDAEIYVGEMSF